MATEYATKLNEMFRNIPDQSAGLDNNISQLQDIRDELNEQINAIENGLLDVSANRLKTFLDGKALALEHSYIFRGIWEEGISYNINETVVVSSDDPFIDSTSVYSTHYQCTVPHTSAESNFPAGDGLGTYWQIIPFDAVDYRSHTGANYNSTNLTSWSVQQSTYIPPVFPAVIGTYIWVVVYSLTVNWDSNTQVTKLISDWDYGYDYLIKELDASGTYGLIAQRDNVNTAISLITNNKNKIEGGLTVLPDYTP